jgi:hypothetical protein
VGKVQAMFMADTATSLAKKQQGLVAKAEKRQKTRLAQSRRRDSSFPCAEVGGR